MFGPNKLPDGTLYGDPVPDMQIAPYKSLPNVLSVGRFGCVRNLKETCNSNYHKGLARQSGTQLHSGTDIFAIFGQDLHAIISGKVTIHDVDDTDLGLFVTIEGKYLDKTIWVRYCHLSEISKDLKDSVLKGDIIGKAGESGNAKGETPHVHIEISNSNIFYGGTDRFDPETVFTTKFDLNGNVIK